MSSILGFGGAFLAFPLEQIPILSGLLPYTISDHFPQNYIEACANHRSEYGDDRTEKISDVPRGRVPLPVPLPSIPLPSMRHLPLPKAWPLAARLPVSALGSLRLLRDLTGR
jgi:hypothetical protein